MWHVPKNAFKVPTAIVTLIFVFFLSIANIKLDFDRSPFDMVLYGNEEVWPSRNPSPMVNHHSKLSLDQWQQVQQSAVSIQHEVSTVKCKPLIESTGATALLVWSYDGPPDDKRLRDSISSFPDGTTIHIFCGSTPCLEQAKRIRMDESRACLQIHRLYVQELAKDTPLETWANHHVLAKLLSGHLYEHHLQIAMQLAAAWKHGGVLLQPGVQYQAGKFTATDSIGTCHGVAATVTPTAGGFWGVSTTKPKSELVQNMIEEFVKSYSWDKPIRDRYNAAKWPLDFSMESMTSGSSVSLKSGCPQAPFTDGYRGPAKYFGTLNYDVRHQYLVKYQNNHGMNLGDETQGLAGIQVLPRLDAFVERDKLEMVRFTDTKTPPLIQDVSSTFPDDGRRVHMFMNAWWGTPTMTWPPPKGIAPISISMHIQPREEITRLFQELPNSTLDIRHVAPFLKGQAPIGARDTNTLKFLRDNGILALFSGCLTMTLSLPKVDRDGGVLIVDVDAEKQLKGVVPDSVLEDSTYFSQKLLGDDADDCVLRFVLAFERLLAYSRARLVITNRLHVAMPCVALDTPVIFVHGKSLPGGGGNRMDGLDVFMHQMKENNPMPDSFDWMNPPTNPRGEDFKKHAKRIQQLSICHEGISDPSRKFGVSPAYGDVGVEDAVCTRETAWSVKPDAIHIATTIDANFFYLVFPSWLNALSKSNPHEPLVLYILTVKLSWKQRCLLRLMVIKLLPNAQVFTIPTSVSEFEKSYHKKQIKHVSIATQARLRLPSILPCIRKVMWIDLDAFVVGPIRPTWDKPTAACGITGRSSIINFMGKYFPAFMTWSTKYGKSFNAGVMLLDLQHLREIEFEETIAAYWAVKEGANDQVTLNLACNGTHEELETRENVFQGVAAEDTPARSEWIIAHFQSPKKPWSKGFLTWNVSSSSQYFIEIWEENKLTFDEVLNL